MELSETIWGSLGARGSGLAGMDPGWDEGRARVAVGRARTATGSPGWDMPHSVPAGRGEGLAGPALSAV